MKNLLFVLLFFAVVNFTFGQTTQEPMAEGPYEASWESLKQYETPEWFKNVKFGIWAHWGPQCQPEQGDWYARFMYATGGGQYNWHVANYGNPSVFGFKDVINEWKAERWNPDYLVDLYKQVGAQYFFALGNHHDNMDLWDSQYQPWNSVNMGPKKDVLQAWSDAAKRNDLPFGVSIHASHAWTWYELSQKYDGNLTQEDGVGKWWEGYDPQDLYAQRHTPSSGWEHTGTIHGQWEWQNGASIPTAEYIDNIYNRTIDMINRYDPDLVYFDDTALPFYPINNTVGPAIAAHLYNKSIEKHGTQEAIVLGKILNEEQKECMVWDVERGAPNDIQEKYWQTCTCIGDWHYSSHVYNNNYYKSAKTVLNMLVDVISKNGNLLLSIPMKGDGTIDNKEEAILREIGEWMDVYKESIYETRPWFVFGEGPSAEKENPLNDQGFNEGTNYTYKDIRFVTKGNDLYATVMGRPDSEKVIIKSLATNAVNYPGSIQHVELLGHGQVEFSRDRKGLTIDITGAPTNEIAIVFKISFGEIAYADFQQIVSDVEMTLTEAKRNTGSNTGQYNESAINALEEMYSQVKGVSGSDTTEKILAAFEKLHKAFVEFEENAYNAGVGIDFYSNTQNVTVKYLIEARNFSRVNNSTTRFGNPLYWETENFYIPQNSSDGIKQGVDKYSGYNTLMMGVWDDASRGTGDLSNATLYRKITLPVGKYFFGAAYQTLYNSYANYIFASEQLPSMSSIDTDAFAYYDITTGHDVSSGEADDSIVNGIEFTLTEEKEFYLGWITDLTTSNTQEFRVKEIFLLKILDENEPYDESLAFTPVDGVIELGMNEFAEVKKCQYKMLTDNTGYLIGESDSYINLGIIDFDKTRFDRVYVNAAYTSSESPDKCFELYLDNQENPIVTIPVVKTSSITAFSKQSKDFPEITGVHQVGIKYKNHNASLKTVSLEATQETNLLSTECDRQPQIIIYNNIISISNLTGNDINIYNLKGECIVKDLNVVADRKYEMKAGTYIIKVGEKANKVIIQ